MVSALTPIQVADAQGINVMSSPTRAHTPNSDLVHAFLAGRSANTHAAYRRDLDGFRAFVGALTLDEAAALRALVALARTVGLITWTLDVAGLKTQVYCDTRGPGTAGVDALLDVAEGRGDAKGVRDSAIIACLYDLALRRGEVVSLDREHLDLAAGAPDILGKGNAQRVRVTLPPQTRATLAAWIAIRGDAPGALFTCLDPLSKGDGRLSANGLYRVVRRLGVQARLDRPVRPHALRQAGVTAALDAANGDVRRVQRFSRHKDLRTVLIYDDNRQDFGGQIACLVAATRRTRTGTATR